MPQGDERLLYRSLTMAWEAEKRRWQAAQAQGAMPEIGGVVEPDWSPDDDRKV
jgi:hypothetical protein